MPRGKEKVSSKNGSTEARKSGRAEAEDCHSKKHQVSIAVDRAGIRGFPRYPDIICPAAMVSHVCMQDVRSAKPDTGFRIELERLEWMLAPMQKISRQCGSGIW